MNRSSATPANVEEFDLLDKVTEFHCPRVGVVRAEGLDGAVELVQFS